ncbi:MAG: STAS domain-containing protein [Magnetospirillum sp.]|nr:STAS domain-containing protein [Magnetospirillum sp.]
MANEPLEQDGATLVLDPVQTLQTIEVTKDLLVQRVATTAGLVVDCSRIEEADVSIVQLLLSARKTAAQFGGALRLAALSPALRAVLERCGVTGGAADDPFWNGAAS